MKLLKVKKATCGHYVKHSKLANAAEEQTVYPNGGGIKMMFLPIILCSMCLNNATGYAPKEDYYMEWNQ